MNLLRKNHFGQLCRFNSLNMPNIRLIESKNLTQNDFPSLRSPKSDRLQLSYLHMFRLFCSFYLHLLAVTLALVSTPLLAAKITVQENEDTGLVSWVAESDGFSIELIQLLPDFIRAVYLSHDYPREEVEKIAGYCAFGSVIKNTSQQVLDYDVSEWTYTDSDGQSYPVKSKTQWLEEWQKAGISVTWTLLPDKGTFYAGDWQQGFTTIKLPRESQFSITYKWKLDGVEHTDVFEGLRCGPDTISEK